MAEAVAIRRLTAENAASWIEPLSDILVDCVEGGACVNFLLPFGRDEARGFWLRTLDKVADGQILLFGAFRGDDLVGTVQIGRDVPPNQRHRGEVRKLLVHRRARGLGIGAALMAAAEREASAAGLALLTLDTAKGDADGLYDRLGWTRAGSIPDYAMLPAGGLCDTVLFWKRLPPP